MKNFYYSTDKLNQNNQHVIHTMDCTQLPSIQERTLVGFEKSGEDAIRTAQTYLRIENVILCPSCCP